MMGARFAPNIFEIYRRASPKRHPSHSAHWFRAEFRHQGEESEFCLRMLDRGYVVRRGTAEAILHHESPKRDRSKVLWHVMRNSVVSILFNYPMPDMFAHLTAKMINGVRRGISYRMYLTPPSGLLSGYAYALPRLNQRKPVRRATLALFERLRRGGPLRLSDAKLPLR